MHIDRPSQVILLAAVLAIIGFWGGPVAIQTLWRGTPAGQIEQACMVARMSTIIITNSTHAACHR